MSDPGGSLALTTTGGPAVDNERCARGDGNRVHTLIEQLEKMMLKRMKAAWAAWAARE